MEVPRGIRDRREAKNGPAGDPIREELEHEGGLSREGWPREEVNAVAGQNGVYDKLRCHGSGQHVYSLWQYHEDRKGNKAGESGCDPEAPLSHPAVT